MNHARLHSRVNAIQNIAEMYRIALSALCRSGFTPECNESAKLTQSSARVIELTFQANAIIKILS